MHVLIFCCLQNSSTVYQITPSPARKTVQFKGVCHTEGGSCDSEDCRGEKNLSQKSSHIFTRVSMITRVTDKSHHYMSLKIVHAPWIAPTFQKLFLISQGGKSERDETLFRREAA